MKDNDSVSQKNKPGSKGKSPFLLAKGKKKCCANTMDLPKGRTSKPKTCWDA